METIKTDVLVIGGGGAGMRAALAAKEEGAKVLLVSKTPLGKSTCTYFSGGGIAMATEGMSRETHLERTLKAGKGINRRELVDILIQEVPERVEELERLGLTGKRRPGSFYTVGGRPPGWGGPLADFLADLNRKQGISFMPWTMVSELILEEGKAAGALGFDYRKGVPLAFNARSILLANGGGAALYGRNDNPVRTTGDGYALAYEAGCRLLDMEFVQFFPTGLAEPGKPTYFLRAHLSDVGAVVNSKGEEIYAKYGITDRPAAMRSRDAFSLALFREKREGREVFLDLRSVSRDAWFQKLNEQDYHIYMENFSAREKPIRIAPMCHFTMGGVVTDLAGKTDVPGLYAAGEVCGGMHGANRMGGNALGEILVFGARAGKAAGQWARERSGGKSGEVAIQSRMAGYEKNVGITAAGLPPRSLRKEIGEILWEKAGILRDKRGLSQALESLESLKAERFPKMRSATPKEVLEKIEVEKAFVTGEMIIRSALLREESRGAHFREDFPQTDDQKWKGNILLHKTSSGMNLEFQPLR